MEKKGPQVNVSSRKTLIMETLVWVKKIICF